MGDEWARHGAAGDGLHHRRLDFDESVRVESAAHRLHELGALQKHFAHFRIDHQVDIALPVAHFDVGERVPVLRATLGGGICLNCLPNRQWEQVFAEKGDLFDVNA